MVSFRDLVRVVLQTMCRRVFQQVLRNLQTCERNRRDDCADSAHFDWAYMPLDAATFASTQQESQMRNTGKRHGSIQTVGGLGGPPASWPSTERVKTAGHYLVMNYDASPYLANSFLSWPSTANLACFLNQARQAKHGFT